MYERVKMNYSRTELDWENTLRTMRNKKDMDSLKTRLGLEKNEQQIGKDGGVDARLNSTCGVNPNKRRRSRN